jgi:hypothetical protein
VFYDPDLNDGLRTEISNVITVAYIRLRTVLPFLSLVMVRLTAITTITITTADGAPAAAADRDAVHRVGRVHLPGVY